MIRIQEHTLRVLTVLSACVALAGCGGKTAVDHIKLAHEVALRLGDEEHPLQHPYTRAVGSMTEVVTDTATFSFNEEGQLMIYHNRYSVNRPIKGTARIRSSSEAESRAIQTLTKLQISDEQFVQQVDFFTDMPVSSSFYGTVRVALGSHPYGYKSHGYGNHVTVILAVESGKLFMLERTTDWAYDPPAVQVSEAEAIRLACERLQASESEVVATDLAYFQGDPNASIESRQFNAQKRCRLTYQVITKKGTAAVDAETGVSLALFRARPPGRY